MEEGRRRTPDPQFREEHARRNKGEKGGREKKNEYINIKIKI